MYICHVFLASTGDLPAVGFGVGQLSAGRLKTQLVAKQDIMCVCVRRGMQYGCSQFLSK